MYETRYDEEYLYDRMKTMNKEYEEAKRITKTIKVCLKNKKINENKKFAGTGENVR